MAIELLEDQILGALNHGGYVLALMGALCLPDIAGAMETEDGRAERDRYVRWYDRWVAPLRAEAVQALFEQWGNPNVPHDLPHPISGANCWAFRCAMLHQGRSEHPDMRNSCIMFLEPGSKDNGIHYAEMGEGGPLQIKLETFCGQIVEGSRRWRREMAGQEIYEHNLARGLRRHPESFRDFRLGGPIVT